ncbi:protocadherin alpha-3-like isoform X9 [Syngnathoides biaculeatus]|uniref:protocadherin alpha-3-like isoform X9 n=1 Tax=Syngnathoides biaculeatus TaxID=300417 RepID=UPI002ADD78AB|nr:protocadherin alpha-3-like isoform X9 [Syngnathoides biaculeatus]
MRADEYLWIGVVAVLLFCCGSASQFSYSVSEETDKGTVVGNIAKDLDLDLQELHNRDLRVVSSYSKKYIDTDPRTGNLFVHDKMDREELCPNAAQCLVRMQAVLSNPTTVHRIDINVVDVNDNSPKFEEEVHTLKISENVAPGERYFLPEADDLDTGSNLVNTYKLSPNEHFTLDVQSAGKRGVSAELVLHKSLDREKQPVHELTLTAVDGGKPTRSGTLKIRVVVMDVNDNTPVFSKSLYKVRVSENAPRGSFVIKLNATDIDEGINSRITYSFIKRGNNEPSKVFNLNSETGEITVKGALDYEETPAYEVRIQAADQGPVPRSAHAKLLVEVVDVNDNAPQITVTSLMTPVKENAELGTIVALVTVSDKDAGDNGAANCQVLGSPPFKLNSNYKNDYSLIVDGALDRENISFYNVSIIATDEGSPPLSTRRIITVQLSDVNDNAPRFMQPVINVYVEENSPAGYSLCSVKAHDPDLGQNAKVSYTLLDIYPRNVPISSLLNINPESGDIVSLQSFDYETLQTLEFQVQATDGGVPPLSGNVSVNLFILDQNDNSPRILPPYSEHGSANGESVPYSAEAGYFVAKIRAVDADSGYNALLSYQLSEPKGGNGPLFRIGSGSGEIRTRRRMSEDDLKSHPLVVSVCDHGEASLSATVSIDVLVLESTADIRTQFRHVPRKEESFSRLHLYLLIAIAAVSLVFLLSLLAFVAFKCRRRTDGGAPVIAAHPDGSWSYSKATQQYDVCLGSDTLKSDLVLFPAAFPPAEAELISIHGGDTFTRTQTLPNSEKTLKGERCHPRWAPESTATVGTFATAPGVPAAPRST